MKRNGFENWNIPLLEKLQREKKIQGFSISNGKLKPDKVNGRIVAKHYASKSKEKNYIGWNLLVWCNEHSVILLQEFTFDPHRKFRFDYCIPALKVAVEYNGIMCEKSGHTTAKGYTKDMVKLNLAQSQGWKVLQFTPLNYTTLLTELNRMYEISK